MNNLVFFAPMNLRAAGPPSMIEHIHWYDAFSDASLFKPVLLTGPLTLYFSYLMSLSIL
jgi:hypothetical protein